MSRRCRHQPFTVTALVASHADPTTPTGSTLEVEFEPSCDEDSCSFVNDLPEQYEDHEIEWIAEDKIILHPARSNSMENVRSVSRFTTVREGRDSDMAPMIECWRDGDLIALVQCLQVSRDDALEALMYVAGGMNLDSVVVAMDAYVTERPTNPFTGDAWQQGDMARAAENDLATERGITTDCITVIEYGRDGRHEQVIVPYRTEGDQIVWQEAKRTTSASGRVVEVLQQAFAVHPLGDEDLLLTMEEADEVLTPEERRAHADCAIAKMVMHSNPGHYAVMMNGYSDVATEVIQRSFSEDGHGMDGLDVVGPDDLDG